MVFAFIILLLLWLFQYFFLEKYYEGAKIRNISSAAKDIINAYGTDEQDPVNRTLAFDNNLCIIITDEMTNVLAYENNLGSFSFLSQNLKDEYGVYLLDLINELESSDERTVAKISRNESFKSREIFYCTAVYADGSDGQVYLFIESSIEPIDATVNIIRGQLIYITIILFELAFIVTIFISKRLSMPITEITETAKKFGEGDYSVEFDVKGYSEIEELSNVLDNAKNEIKKVSDLRKDLIANVSHDLRTPLTMVKAYAEMIRDLSGDNPEKRNEHVQIIIDEADRLSALVNNLLELSKLESGNIELERKNFSIKQKLEDCMTRYKLLIEKDGYDIRLETDEDRLVNADPDKLDQVIYNFINNAVNYSGENKVIRVRQINKESTVRIEVEDNGRGISKELLPKVFDRYYRDSKVKRDVVGTGLGLSICQQILKLHGFAYGVSSEEGKGSVFWFEADIAKEPKQRIAISEEK
ncbi:MAG: HAMP domain-containing histidine kinase [Ruminococcus sp.]|nr:HAMP domain-containing histidine kinase [Ruminococcus sp.]